MEIAALCAIVASVRVIPSSTQFFQYESLTLSCGDSSEWKVKRSTSTQSNKECSVWGRRNESLCFIDDLYPQDTGVYWCESGAGECINAINITVTTGSVILESPVLPVPEGEAVTLRCRSKTNLTSSLTSEFYKDGLPIGSSSTGNMTILSVSKSDEGLYKCNISGAGQSKNSWLAVRAGHPESFHSSLAHILLPVVGVCVLLALVSLCLWRIYKGKSSSDLSYTDVIITQEVPPKRDREMDDVATFYSTIKPGAT
ncbi:low affinity immunoglobulin gamma Fc region receptor II-a-like [Chelmon rostratus]|uniref:low affinity immunoglobulin gamma Fc region receptor II-a-like n=1 Tax=Chelmon rostratus TaxID=109905 RepID=UPI001BE80333|nr:low affinity immunoglobulin gamma Fc region receptor II-a-like [Chelmon rostratus]